MDDNNGQRRSLTQSLLQQRNDNQATMFFDPFDGMDDELMMAQQASVDLVRRTSSITEGNFNRTQIEKDRLLTQMLMLGYEQDNATYALKMTQYQSIERAISFLYDKVDNDKYEHEFIAYGKNDQLCKLCLDSIDDHKSQLPQQEPVKDKNIGNIQEEDEGEGPNSDEIECGICYCSYSENEIHKFLCGHKFCVQCSQQTLRFSIERNQLDKLICPMRGCGVKLSDEQVKAVFKDDQEIIDKLERFKIKTLLEKDPLVRWCTKENCNGYTRAKSFNEKKVRCDQCKHELCFQCRDDWHGYFTSCQSAMEKKFKGWASGNIDISFCPKCKTKVEKVEGCNHMTCYFCKFQWCWICGGTYTADHYLPMNPFGCGDQQFAKKHKWYIQIWINLGWLLLALILMPLILVFTVPGLIIGLCFEYPLRQLGRKFCKGPHYCVLVSIVGILLAAIGLALNVIAIPLFLVFGLPVVIGVMIYKRVKVHRQANKNLQEILQGKRQVYNYL